MKMKQTMLKNNYANKYLSRNLSSYNASIVLNEQKTVTLEDQTYKLDTHSEVTLRKAIEYAHELTFCFEIDEQIFNSISWQLNIIFRRGYVTSVFNHACCESITLACLICAYQLSDYPMDEAHILTYIQKMFLLEIKDTIISEVNRCYSMLCGLHQIEPNYILIMQFASYFYQYEAQPLYIC
jgi:hypothetical protein